MPPGQVPRNTGAGDGHFSLLAIFRRVSASSTFLVSPWSYHGANSAWSASLLLARSWPRSITCVSSWQFTDTATATRGLGIFPRSC